MKLSKVQKRRDAVEKRVGKVTVLFAELNTAIVEYQLLADSVGTSKEQKAAERAEKAFVKKVRKLTKAVDELQSKTRDFNREV